MFGKLNDRLSYQPSLFNVCTYTDAHTPDTKTCICVKMLPSGNTHKCNGMPMSCTSKTALFIHLYLFNLNSSSFGCPTSCN